MKSSTLLLLSHVLIVNCVCADVVSWRNGGNGLYPESTAPFKWNDKSNILWKVDTPIKGNAAPIIVGDKLFYTAEPADLICVDARNGKELWRTSNSFEDVI